MLLPTLAVEVRRLHDIDRTAWWVLLTLIPFLLSDMITPDLRYFQRDGIHPTADGAQIVAETVLRTIKPLLGPAKN